MNEEEKLRKEFDAHLEEILENVSAKYIVTGTDSTIINENVLNGFFIFKSEQNPSHTGTWMVSNGQYSFFLCSIDIDSTLGVRHNTHTQTHRFLYGFLPTSNDFGKSIFRPETITHKIAELFQRIEIDFPENSSFSNRYYCLSHDPATLNASMSNRLMDYLASVKNLFIEFNHRTCLFRTEKSIIDHRNNLQLFDVGIELSRIIGNSAAIK